jgi:outer membrane lipoprotein-sorting protein
MRKYLLFIIVCFVLIAFYSPSGFAQKDQKAKEWIDKSSDAFQKGRAMSIRFTMNVKDITLKATESFDGTIDLSGPKFHIDTPDMETWFDGKTQWILQKGFDEVNVTEPHPEEIQALNPSTIFSIYKKGCNYKYLGEKKHDSGKVHEVELILQNKNSEITKIALQIASDNYMPTKIHIFYKNKIENIIHIHKYQKNLDLLDSVFTFNKKKYPNVEIIDLR